MSIGMGDLVATLAVDSRKFSSGLSQAQSRLDSFAGMATTRLASIALPAVGSFASIGFASQAVSAAEDHAAAMRKLNAVLTATGGAAGFTAEQIDEYATALQRASNFDGDVTLGAAAILATFRNIKGENFKESLTLMADMATVMGSDLSGAATMFGKALNDPIQGLTALTRVGVSFTDQQREQIRVMQEAGDMAGAQKVILAELAGEFGGAAKAAMKPTEQIKFLLGDLKEEFGNQLLPAVKLFAESATGAMQDLNDEATGLLGTLQKMSDFQTGFFARGIMGMMPQDSFANGPVAIVHPGLKRPPEPEPEPDIEQVFAETPLRDHEAEGEKFAAELRRLDDEFQLAMGHVTKGELAERDAIEEGFSEEAAAALRERIDLLDELRDAQGRQRKEEAEAARAAAKLDFKPEAKGVAALQKGGAEALSAIFKAQHGGMEDKALAEAEKNNEFNQEVVDLLRDVKDKLGGGVTLIAGSLA